MKKEIEYDLVFSPYITLKTDDAFMPGSMEKRRSVSDVNGKKKNRINTDFVEIY